MRKLIITCTALAVLGLAGAAYAASGSFNTYTASFPFNPTTAGTAKHPVPVQFFQNFGVKGTGGNQAAPLTETKSWLYGVVSNGKDFPTCSIKIIEKNHTKYDKSCPKGSLVASGPLKLLLVGVKTPTVGTPCDPYFHVYNGGQGKLVFFPVVFGKYQCAGLHTGAASPYNGTITQQGKFMVTTVKLPPDASTEGGGLRNTYVSLISERLNWAKLTTKVHGKTVAYNESVGCQGNVRPWKTTFTAHNYNGQNGSVTISGSSKC